VGYYNLACLEAKKGEKAIAFDLLSQAHEKGWDDFNHLTSDEDLIPFHGLPEWKALLRKFYTGKVKE
jgi:hypothetical protein